MTVLRTWSPVDGVLGAVAPLALATAAGTALVVDLDPGGPAYPSRASLASLVEEGPRLADLRPRRRGVAVLRNGGVDEDAAAEVLEALAVGWGNVVLRMPSSPERPEHTGVVPVLPLALRGMLPNERLVPYDGPAVYQRGPWAADRHLDGIVLPRPRAATIRSLLEGRRPPWSRWLNAWRPVWSLPWP